MKPGEISMEPGEISMAPGEVKQSSLSFNNCHFGSIIVTLALPLPS